MPSAVKWFWRAKSHFLAGYWQLIISHAILRTINPLKCIGGENRDLFVTSNDAIRHQFQITFLTAIHKVQQKKLKWAQWMTRTMIIRKTNFLFCAVSTQNSLEFLCVFGVLIYPEVVRCPSQRLIKYSKTIIIATCTRAANAFEI